MYRAGQRPDWPHLLVGIDLGMTCTGVSYCNLSIGSNAVKWVQKWPGRMQAAENKCPTCVVYDTANPQGVPVSWGFLSESEAERNAENRIYREWFKTSLDPNFLQDRRRGGDPTAPQAHYEVEKWYEDYMRLLYQHIRNTLGQHLGGVTWENAQIEFIFSVPTTWKPNPTVEIFRRLAQRAGFSAFPGHQITMGLTEAEAAAVHTSLDAVGMFKPSDVLLICDAGGGTTDLSVLRVDKVDGRVLSLKQLDIVYGAEVGSTSIDVDFEDQMKTRLSHVAQAGRLHQAVETTAWDMMKSVDFQNNKCAHGDPYLTPTFTVNIPKVEAEYSNPELRIERGRVVLTRPEMQAMFDKQMVKIFELIDDQLRKLQQTNPYERVAHIVLSGGLGNSLYVQQCLQARYANESLQVHIAPDPQLSVCKGLVEDRLQKLQKDEPVLGWRCARASYGTICKVLFDPSNPRHTSRTKEKDRFDGKVYVVDCVYWFIRKGQPVNEDRPVEHHFSRKVTPGDPRRIFPTTVVVSYVDSDFLPDHMTPAVEELCKIESDLSGANELRFKEKNKHFWSRRRHYWRVDYEVKVVIGPADIRFELWFNDQKMSKDRPIKVEWAAAATPPPPMPPPMYSDAGVLVR